MRFGDKEVNLIEYPLFDALLNGVGVSQLRTGALLFAKSSAGDPGLSNMQLAGQIPSGGIYMIRGLQGAAYFQSLADTEFATAYGGSAGVPAYTAGNVTSTPARMQDCYSMLAYGCQLTLTIARVPAVILPWYSIPAAGGPFGSSNNQGRAVITNGVPQFTSTLNFVEPVIISSLQNFSVKADFYEFQNTSVAGQFTGSGQGGTISTLQPLNFLNSADGIKFAGVKMRGFQSFDIQ